PCAEPQLVAEVVAERLVGEARGVDHRDVVAVVASAAYSTRSAEVLDGLAHFRTGHVDARSSLGYQLLPHQLVDQQPLEIVCDGTRCNSVEQGALLGCQHFSLADRLVVDQDLRGTELSRLVLEQPHGWCERDDHADQQANGYGPKDDGPRALTHLHLVRSSRRRSAVR